MPFEQVGKGMPFCYLGYGFSFCQSGDTETELRKFRQFLGTIRKTLFRTVHKVTMLRLYKTAAK